MQQYLQYIFQSFNLKSSSKLFNRQIKSQLLQLKQVQLVKYYKSLTTSQQLFNQLNLLLAKGVIKYSPSNCLIQLSLPNVMIYQRLYKAEVFANKYLDHNVSEFIQEFISKGVQNGMGFPVLFQNKKLQKIFSPQSTTHDQIPVQQSSKKKLKPVPKPKHNQSTTQQKLPMNQQQHYNYQKLIYEYKSQQQKSPLVNQNQEKKHQTVNQKISRMNGKTHKDKDKSQRNQDFEEYMLNVQELTKLLQASKCVQMLNKGLGQKQKKLSLFEFISLKQRQTIIQQLKYQKLQQYIAQILSVQCLLVFNLIRKYPYITQKQLIKLTLLDVLQTRASLNKLVEIGFVYFYNQNVRTVVYKIIDQRLLEKKYMDMIGMTMLNLNTFSQNIETIGMPLAGDKLKNKLIQLQCQMQRLDDVMLIFGW